MGKRFVYGNRKLAHGVTMRLRVMNGSELFICVGVEGVGDEYIRRKDMMEIKITLRIEFDREGKAEREKLMLDIAKDTSKELLAQAAMIQGKRAPAIALECGDFFADEAKIKLFDETEKGS